MQAILRTLLALVAVMAAAVPAAAQTAAPAADTGMSLLWVWVWLIPAGITIMIIGTSIGVNSNKR
jgi:hypothetical protein